MKTGDKTASAKGNLPTPRGKEEMSKKIPTCGSHTEFMSKNVSVRHGKGEFKEGQ